MKVSFYVNRKDLQEVNFLVENYRSNAPYASPFDKSKFTNKAIAVECFNSSERVVSQLEIRPNPLPSSFIEVTIDYNVYDKIQEYLTFR